MFGIILQWDGTAWTIVSSGTASFLDGVWDATRQPIRPPVLDFGALGRGPIEDMFLLKLSYDFGG
jgi:hypothetical protein